MEDFTAPYNLKLPHVREFPAIRGYFSEHASSAYCYEEVELKPEHIKEDAVKALESISNQSFEIICSSLYIVAQGNPIQNKSDLSNCTSRGREQIERRFIKKYNQRELSAFIFFLAEVKDFDITKLVNQYNKAKREEQLEIYSFFNSMYNGFDIGVYMELVSENMYKKEPECTARSQKIEDRLHYFCPHNRAWVRDDIFRTQFQIRASSGIIGYAGTIEDAIILASKACMDSDFNLVSNYVKIDLNDRLIAIGLLDSKPDGSRAVTWQKISPIRKNGALEEAFKDIHTNDPDEIRREQNSIRMGMGLTPMDENEINEAILKVSRELNLHKTLRQFIEEDLGL